jgi:peptidoglycan-associated lipoprotein
MVNKNLEGTKKMRLKISGLLMAATLLTACDCAQDDTATASGQGGSALSQGAVAPGTAADFVANVGDRVFFDLDKSTVRAEGSEAIKRQGEWLKKYPNMTVTVAGHCDERGTTEYNLALGERRANAAKEMLIAQGIDAARVKVVSFGKERPVAEGHTEEAYQQNRVAITVID